MAESLTAFDGSLHRLHHLVEEHAAGLLEAGAEPAAELGPLIAAVHINAEVERMAQLARQVAEVARSRRPAPAHLEAVVREMARVCVDMAAVPSEAGSRGLASVSELDGGRDEIERLRQQLYWALLSGSESVDVRAAVDLTLVGRYYECFADHVVSVARHLALLPAGAAGV